MSEQELPPVPPDLVAVIEKLADELPDQPGAEEASRRLEWLLDALIMRGQLPASFKRLAAKIQADRGTKVRLSIVDDKRSIEGPDIDCASLIPLCGARCCSFEVVLSREDVREGEIPWIIDEPYLLPRDPLTKRCACMDDERRCTVYEARPATCRSYDCRDDRRVWLDYEKRIPAPLPAAIRPDGYVPPDS